MEGKGFGEARARTPKAPENHKIISVWSWKGGIIKEKHRATSGIDGNGVAPRELPFSLSRRAAVLDGWGRRRIHYFHIQNKTLALRFASITT